MTTYNQPPQNYQFLEIFCICFSTQRIYLVISGGYETCTNQNRSYIADKKSVVHSPKLITSPTIEIPLVALAFDGRVAVMLARHFSSPWPTMAYILANLPFVFTLLTFTMILIPFPIPRS